jgi:hypothetical protein
VKVAPVWLVVPDGPESIVVWGAVESSTYVNPLEHALVLPAASVAVALNVVLESSATVTVRPGEAKAAAVPVAAAAPEQSLLV